jgi:hypothetical protein
VLSCYSFDCLFFQLALHNGRPNLVQDWFPKRLGRQLYTALHFKGVLLRLPSDLCWLHSQQKRHHTIKMNFNNISSKKNRVLSLYIYLLLLCKTLHCIIPFDVLTFSSSKCLRWSTSTNNPYTEKLYPRELSYRYTFNHTIGTCFGPKSIDGQAEIKDSVCYFLKLSSPHFSYFSRLMGIKLKCL